MRALANLATFVVAAFVCLVAAMAGLGVSAGKDIGFAGGGIWFLILPGAVLGPALIFIVSRFSKWPDDQPFAQRVTFVVLSAALAFALGAAPTALMKLQTEREAASRYVYAPAPGFTTSLEISAPREAIVGVPLPVGATLKQGPWELVSYAKLVREPRYKAFAGHASSQEPPAVDSSIGGRLIWTSDPPQPGERFDLQPPTYPGEQVPTALIFRAPGTYRVSARSFEPTDTRSNEVTVTVTAPEYVFVPAPDYRAQLEISVPAEVVQYEPVTVKAVARRGPWERIRFAALKEERYHKFARRYRVEKPSGIDEDAAARVIWSTRPDIGVNVKEPMPGSLERQLVFLGAGTVEVRAALWGEDSPVESNPVNVTVRETRPK